MFISYIIGIVQPELHFPMYPSFSKMVGYNLEEIWLLFLTSDYKKVPSLVGWSGMMFVKITLCLYRIVSI